jgi:hypothetical protein
MMAKKLTIPELLRISKFPWGALQINGNSSTEIPINERRATRSRCPFKSRKAPFFKPAQPVMNGRQPMVEKLSRLAATKLRAHDKNALELQLTSPLPGSHDLLLHNNSHNLCILNFKRAHVAMPPFSCRHYSRKDFYV